MFTSRPLNVVTAIVLIAVLILTIQEAIATSSIVADIESASRSPYVHNPELNAADRFSSANEASVASNLLTMNPELSSVRRYSGNERDVNSSLVENPELSAANRFARPTYHLSESALLSANPELSVAWRFAAERTR